LRLAAVAAVQVECVGTRLSRPTEPWSRRPRTSNKASNSVITPTTKRISPSSSHRLSSASSLCACGSPTRVKGYPRYALRLATNTALVRPMLRKQREVHARQMTGRRHTADTTQRLYWSRARRKASCVKHSCIGSAVSKRGDPAMADSIEGCSRARLLCLRTCHDSANTCASAAYVLGTHTPSYKYDACQWLAAVSIWIRLLDNNRCQAAFVLSTAYSMD